MKEIIIVKYGEIILKGLNRPNFERKLVANLKHALALSEAGEYDLWIQQAAIYVRPLGENADLDRAVEAIRKVFGVTYVSRVFETEKTMESLLACAKTDLKPSLSGLKTFKVETKRADKRFPLDSQQISREVGGAILSANPHLKVDVHQPDGIVWVEIREEHAYIYQGKLPGMNGMPTGTGGRATLLLSGGIDSPVAGFMMAKRGVELEAVHFHSPPYTSERAKEKVLTLAKQLAKYAGKMRVHMVPFTDIQMDIYENAPHDYLTLIMRRVMMQIAERLALYNHTSALITGESLGQVASQTMESLRVTDAVVTKMPVFRPLIGMDKEEIVTIARRIDTFETSILPYEDCCTVFVPKHPRTKPQLQKVIEAEAAIDIPAWVQKAIDATETIII